jgi:hypothetical protein
MRLQNPDGKVGPIHVLGLLLVLVVLGLFVALFIHQYYG